MRGEATVAKKKGRQREEEGKAEGRRRDNGGEKEGETEGKLEYSRGLSIGSWKLGQRRGGREKRVWKREKREFKEKDREMKYEADDI